MTLFTLVVALHAVVSVLARGKSLCHQDTDNGALEFQSKPGDTTLDIIWLLGTLVQLDCCLNGLTNTTVINWEINGTILSDINTTTSDWTLSEQQQVLTVSGPGFYVCSATDGPALISKRANITSSSWDPTCRQGTIGALRAGYPVTDVYNVAVNTGYSLTCEALLYCGDEYTMVSVQWSKFPEGSDGDVYNLYVSSDPANSMDKATGDWVNVTKWVEDATKREIFIRAVLNIQNVTKYELYDENLSLNNCPDNSSSACSSNDDKYYYQCAIILEESDDLSKNMYHRVINTRLHSFSSTTMTAANAATRYGDPSDWKREGIIFGCLLGAFVLVVALVALLYVRYEWHIRVYLKRLAIMARSRGNIAHHFTYDCYVACAREDESLVCGVLSDQLEKRLDYTLCLPERDFAIGSAIPEQVGSFIEKSEYFLAIISPRFWNTDWCKLAMDMALRTNAKVIAVFILDSPKAKADKRSNVAQALKAPGCSEYVFRTWKAAQGHDSLVLKLQCALPRPRNRSRCQLTPEALAVQSTI